MIKDIRITPNAINVIQNKKLEFNFCLVSRDSSALFVSLTECEQPPLLSRHSSLMMAMLAHLRDTGRKVTELCLQTEAFCEDGIADIRDAWKKAQGVELTINYSESFEELLRDISARPKQADLFNDCDRCGLSKDECCCILPDDILMQKGGLFFSQLDQG